MIYCRFVQLLKMNQKENPTNFSGCTISGRPCRIFEMLNPEETKLLEDGSVRIKYKKREMICKQGSFVSHVVYMEQGLAKVFIDDGQNLLVLKILPSCNLLGLTSVSEETGTYPYSAMAYIESEVRLIDINVFKQLLAKNSSFAREVIDILSANSVQIYSRFFCMTHKQAYGRLADILLCLSDRVFKQDTFDLPLSRKELAELSGMSSETVIRMLKKFSDDRLIMMDGKKLKLIDYDRLKRISEIG